MVFQKRQLSVQTKLGELCVELHITHRLYCDPSFICSSQYFCEDVEFCDDYKELDCDTVKFTCNYVEKTFCEEYFRYIIIGSATDIDAVGNETVDSAGAVDGSRGSDTGPGTADASGGSDTDTGIFHLDKEEEEASDDEE